ncbi:hypothetical protein D9M68_789330 [compost metagenome]
MAQPTGNRRTVRQQQAEHQPAYPQHPCRRRAGRFSCQGILDNCQRRQELPHPALQPRHDPRRWLPGALTPWHAVSPVGHHPAARAAGQRLRHGRPAPEEPRRLGLLRRAAGAHPRDPRQREALLPEDSRSLHHCRGLPGHQRGRPPVLPEGAEQDALGRYRAHRRRTDQPARQLRATEHGPHHLGRQPGAQEGRRHRQELPQQRGSP